MSASDEFYVYYDVEGFGQRCAGPYARHDAEYHREDIRGYCGVSKVYISLIPPETIGVRRTDEPGEILGAVRLQSQSLAYRSYRYCCKVGAQRAGK